MQQNSIRYLTRKEISNQSWDACIDQSANGLVYAYSFYLDAMIDNWDALVINDYEAVMPLPWRKKYGIPYLYQPAFVAQLGLFGKNISAELLQKFLSAIPSKFKYWDFTLNHSNVFPIPDFPLYQRSNFVLCLNRCYDDLFSQYRENIKRNIKKAKNYGCLIETDIAIEQIIGLARQQVQQNPITEKDFTSFTLLYHALKQKSKAVSYGVFSQQHQLLASCVFFFSHNRAYYILVGNHPNGRTLGASHLLIDAFIRDYASKDLLLDFEGSDLRNLAFFYSSFGAVEEKYAAIQLNRLPWYLRWLKN
jgi:hypothetical protein